MNPKKKYDLSEILAEIEADINEQPKDLSQEKDIPQDIITDLVFENLKKKNS
jgi:hypothetical protein